MSRYFQQLARHAGLAAPGPVGARLAPAATPAPQTDIIEEIVERDAAPAGPVASAPSAAASALSAPAPAADAPLPVETKFSAAPSLPETPISAEPKKNPPPAYPAPATRKIGASETDRSTPAAPPPVKGSLSRPVSPDAATVIHQVIAWVTEPERARLAPSTPGQASSAPSLPTSVSASPLPPMIAPPAASPAGTQLAMSVQSDVPAAGPAKKTAPSPRSDSSRLELSAAAPVALTLPSGSPPAAAFPSMESPSDYHVSIGSIQLTVETPPPAAPAAPPRAPRPAPPRPAPGQGSGLPTRARRHYLRSFT